MRSLLRAAVAACVVVPVGASFAQTVSVDFTTSRTNTLYEDPLGETSGGAAPWIFAGLTQQPSLRRGLLAFDVSSIPAGATVTGVTLTLHVSRTSTGVEPASIHRVLNDWGSGDSLPNEPGGTGAPAAAGDATWLNTFFVPGGGGAAWTNAGGDFDDEALAVALVGGPGFYSWSSDELTADVQRWVAEGPGANFGWMLLGNESVPQSAKRYDSGNAADSRVRPRLTVTYVVPGPGGCGLVVLAGAWGARRRHRR